jgi:hypothetical protein
MAQTLPTNDCLQRRRIGENISKCATPSGRKRSLLAGHALYRKPLTIHATLDWLNETEKATRLETAIPRVIAEGQSAHV